MRTFLRRLARTVLPSWLRQVLRSVQLLMFDLGHLRSIRTGVPADRHGRPIPWFTYPAIAYLEQLDLSDADVFEYGSGNSTRFWQERARTVTSVEDDPSWHARIARTLDPARVSYHLELDPARYIEAIEGGTYDVIVIDGSHRERCIRPALTALRDGGVVVLDNADWYPQQAAELRAAGLIEVDFTGMSPVKAYILTTSLFLHRGFAMRPLHGVQPSPGIGAIPG
jgi:hypothetical protein